MIRKIAVIWVCISSLLVFACSKEKEKGNIAGELGSQQKSNVVTGHGGSPVNVDDKAAVKKNGTVEALKDMKLADYPARTIGEVFEGYTHFSSREWKETRTHIMKVYVDFYGFQKPGVLALGDATKKTYSRGINVKFVINPDGSFYVAMVSKVEIMSDGKMYVVPIEDKKKVLDAIYSNMEINL